MTEPIKAAVGSRSFTLGQCANVRPTVVLSEQFYYPDGWGGAQLPRDLTVHLANRGYRVEVICGSDPYAPTNEEDDVKDPRDVGVVIRKTPRFFGGGFHRLRLLRQILFYVCCIPPLLLRRRPAIFLTQTNPPLLVPIVAFAALIHRRPLVIIAQDIYPEVIFAHGMAHASGISGRVLRRIFQWAYRRAERVIALGDIMAQRLIDKGVDADRVEVISNWATGSVAEDQAGAKRRRSEWGVGDDFLIVYSGNIGVAHDIETPIAALKILLQRSLNVRLLFIGQGSRLEVAERAGANAGVSDAIQFRPPVPSSQLTKTLGIAQVALVTLREGFEGLVVPSKLLGYMARGLATIYVGPSSDVELMLNRSGGGISFRNGAAVELADGIQSLIERPEQLASMGRAAAGYYEAHFSREEGLAKYVNVVVAAVDASA